jgi:hypothetical protein
MLCFSFRLTRAHERGDGHDKHDCYQPETEEGEKWFHDVLLRAERFRLHP